MQTNFMLGVVKAGPYRATGRARQTCPKDPSTEAPLGFGLGKPKEPDLLSIWAKYVWFFGFPKAKTQGAKTWEPQARQMYGWING